jgi:hypothetical protein
MAKMRTGALRKLHADLGQILADYDSSCAAQKAAAGDNELGIGPETSVQGNANDSAARGGKVHTMAEAFPNLNRIPNKM